MRKILKIVLFILSAALLAFIMSYFINNYNYTGKIKYANKLSSLEEKPINKYDIEGAAEDNSIDIVGVDEDNRVIDNLLIDGKFPLGDLIEKDEETPTINSNDNEYIDYSNESEMEDYYISDINGIQGPNIKKDNKKISEEDLTFLTNLLDIADSVTINYSLILEYAINGDFSNGLNNIHLLEEDYKNLENNETNNKSLKEIKKEYLKGINNYIVGFNLYFNHEETSNDYFYESDDNFYNAQMKLEAFLSKYKE